MTGCAVSAVLIALTVTRAGQAAPTDKLGSAVAFERTVVVGAGLADVDSSAFKGGGATFVEYEAIESVLEIELGGQAV